MTQYPIRPTGQTANHSVTSDFGGQFPLALSAAYVLTPIVQQQIARTQRIAEVKQLPVHHSFNAPLFTGTMTVPGQQRDWHVMPLAEDPAWNHKGGFPMPKDVIAQLQRIQAAGIDFPILYIAHETPANSGYLPGPTATVDLMPPPSSKALRSAANLGSAAANLVKLSFAPVLAAGMVGGVALGAAALAAGALVGLDPIIFGVLCDPAQGLKPGTPAAWMYVAHWAWE